MIALLQRRAAFGTSGGGGGGDIAPDSQIFTAGSGSVTVPAGATSLTLTLGGAGGGGSFDPSYGRGAGGGAEAERTIALSGDAGKTIPYSVGARGLGKKNRPGAGSDGGDSTADTSALTNQVGIITAGGGKGALARVAGEGGTATGGTVNTPGSPGNVNEGGISASGAFGGEPGLNGLDYGGGGGPGNYNDGWAMQLNGGDGGRGFVRFDWTY